MSLTEDRKGRITGSRIAGILGISPYTTRDSVLREMVRQHFGADTEFVGNIATEYGDEHEQDAFAAYEASRGVMCEQHDTLVHPEHDFLAATPDGLIGDDGMVEVKCPFRATYRTIAERPDYEAQIRLQLEVFGRAWCDFIVWTPDGITVTRVERDPDWLPSVMPELLTFMEDYQAAVTDESVAAPFLAALKDARGDDAWTRAAFEWIEADLAAKAAKDAADEARKALLSLTDKPASGAGVQVIRSDRKGSLDYERFLREQNLEITDDYRKPGSVVWQVRKAAS